MRHRTDIAIVTAVDVEFEATTAALGMTDFPQVPDGPTYARTTYAGYSIVATRAADKGNVYSAIAARDVIRDFQPSLVVLIGMAGGHGSQVAVGSVVFGSIILGYEYSKVLDATTKKAPRQYRLADQDVQIAAELKPAVRPHIGVIASGSKVVASANFKKELESVHKDVSCLEMEAEGIAAVCGHHIPLLPYFVIKGIADLGDAPTKGIEKSPEDEAAERARQGDAAARAAECLKQILESDRMKQRWPPARSTTARKAPSSRSGPSQERSLVRELKEQLSLHCGGLDLQAQLLPRFQWDGSPSTYQDDPEGTQGRIRLYLLKRSVPQDLLDKLLQELEEEIDSGQGNTAALTRVQDTIVKGGSNPYPRLVAEPYLDHTPFNDELVVPIGPGRYGIALIKERVSHLPTVQRLRERHVLNSLAVRVALLVRNERDELSIEFQQRHPKTNATYRSAWDVAAAGYIDPQKHADLDNPTRISVWQAAAKELAEELNIPRAKLPHRDHYWFFGVGVNRPTGQLDVLGYCRDDDMELDPERAPAETVLRYDRCEAKPETVANFVASKGYWVPTALVTLVLILEALSFPRRRIEDAFRRVGQLKLEP